MRRDHIFNIVLALATLCGGGALAAAYAVVSDPIHAALWRVCAVVGFILLGLGLLAVTGIAVGDRKEREAIEGRRKMVPLVGVVICGIGLIVFAGWYFWPQSKAPAKVETRGVGLAPSRQPASQAASGHGGAAIVNQGHVDNAQASGNRHEGPHGFIGNATANHNLSLSGAAPAPSTSAAALDRPLAYDSMGLVTSWSAEGSLSISGLTYGVHNTGDRMVKLWVSALKVTADDLVVMYGVPPKPKFTFINKSQGWDGNIDRSEGAIDVGSDRKVVTVYIVFDYDTLPEEGIRHSAYTVRFSVPSSKDGKFQSTITDQDEY
jgi:hypothetical protein